MSCTSMDTSAVADPLENPLSPAAIHDYLACKFGANKSKSEIISALEACTVLHRIPLPTPSVTIEQAQKDFKRERVLLNDVAFIPDKDDDERSVAFSLTLRILLGRLMRSPTVCSGYTSAQAVGDLLMQRACRTSAGADSFFTIQQMLSVDGTFVTQNTTLDDPPIHIDVFLSDQAAHARYSRNSTTTTITDDSSYEDGIHLCARALISNSFAVYDTDTFDEEEPSAWLEVDSIVVDESDLKSGEHWRKLHLVITDKSTGKCYSSMDEGRASPTRVRGALNSLWSCHSSNSGSTTTNFNTFHDQLDDCSSLSTARDDQHRPFY